MVGAMIPLTRPFIEQAERDAVAAVLASGRLVMGPQISRFEALVAAACGRRHGVAVSSGTSALHLALTALDVGQGDEVLCPALTWPSPAHAICGVGATAVLVDVDEETWNSGADAFAQARTERTKAAIVIDQFGFPADTPAIAAALPGVAIIEDSACALGSSLGGKACGGFGAIGCFSFHPRKIVTTGEGGMCVTDDAALADRLRRLVNHGQKSAGEFVEASGNHRLGELAAALGVVQMGRLAEIVAARRLRAAKYLDAFSHLTLQQPVAGALPNYQTFGMLMPTGSTTGQRDNLLQRLRARGVEAGILSYALNRLPSLDHAVRKATPHAESIVDRGFALPLFPAMTEVEQATVIRAVVQTLGADT